MCLLICLGWGLCLCEDVFIAINTCFPKQISFFPIFSFFIDKLNKKHLKLILIELSLTDLIYIPIKSNWGIPPYLNVPPSIKLLDYILDCIYYLISFLCTRSFYCKTVHCNSACPLYPLLCGLSPPTPAGSLWIRHLHITHMLTPTPTHTHRHACTYTWTHTQSTSHSLAYLQFYRKIIPFSGPGHSQLVLRRHHSFIFSDAKVEHDIFSENQFVEHIQHEYLPMLWHLEFTYVTGNQVNSMIDVGN